MKREGVDVHPTSGRRHPRGRASGRRSAFISSDADLLEGLQYLAGCIAACTHVAFDYDRDHPFLHSGTGPFTKMGLDNPDTMYFGTRVVAGNEYVVTGTRGTTTDVSFQLLGGEYTDEGVPVSEAAFDDRELDVAADGSFEWRFTPKSNAQLVIREVYNDWSAQRGTFAIARTDTAGTAPPPLTKELIERRYATAGKQLVQRVKTWLQFPKWFYDNLPVNTLTAPRLTPGGLATQYSSVGHYDTHARAGTGHHPAGERRAVSRASSWVASGTSRWTTSTTRHH